MFRNNEIKRVLISFFLFIEVFGNKRGIRESNENNSGMRNSSEKRSECGIS